MSKFIQYKLLYTNLYWSTIGRHSKKTLKFRKKSFLLETRYMGMCTFSTKKLRLTHAIWDTGSYDFIFEPGHHPRFETYTNPFPCHIANPFSIMQRFFHLCNHLLCVFSVKKLVLLVNTQIHITKWPVFFSSIRKKLFLTHRKVPHGTFICAMNKVLQIHRRLIIAFFAARNHRNPIFVSTWNLLRPVE